MHTIFVISSDRMLQETLTFILEDEGYVTEALPTAEALLNQLQTRTTPCVVVLCHLLLAVEVLPKVITMQSALPPIGWILTTAGSLSRLSVAASTMTQLKVTVLPKPFDYNELLSVVGVKMSELPPA